MQKSKGAVIINFYDYKIHDKVLYNECSVQRSVSVENTKSNIKLFNCNFLNHFNIFPIDKGTVKLFYHSNVRAIFNRPCT